MAEQGGVQRLDLGAQTDRVAAGALQREYQAVVPGRLRLGLRQPVGQRGAGSTARRETPVPPAPVPGCGTSARPASSPPRCLPARGSPVRESASTVRTGPSGRLRPVSDVRRRARGVLAVSAGRASRARLQRCRAPLASPGHGWLRNWRAVRDARDRKDGPSGRLPGGATGAPGSDGFPAPVALRPAAGSPPAAPAGFLAGRRRVSRRREPLRPAVPVRRGADDRDPHDTGSRAVSPPRLHRGGSGPA